MSTLGKIDFVGDVRSSATRPASPRLRNDRSDVRPPADVLEFSQEAVGRAANEPSARTDRVAQARYAVRHGGYESDEILDLTVDRVFAELQSFDLRV